jgi:hypothetical protein
MPNDAQERPWPRPENICPECQVAPGQVHLRWCRLYPDPWRGGTPEELEQLEG